MCVRASRCVELLYIKPYFVPRENITRRAARRTSRRVTCGGRGVARATPRRPGGTGRGPAAPSRRTRPLSTAPRTTYKLARYRTDREAERISVARSSREDHRCAHGCDARASQREPSLSVLSGSVSLWLRSRASPVSHGRLTQNVSCAAREASDRRHTHEAAAGAAAGASVDVLRVVARHGRPTVCMRSRAQMTSHPWQLP